MQDWDRLPGVLAKRSTQESLVEFTHSQYGVCAKGQGIQCGMIDAHLSGVGAGTLVVRSTKIGSQVIERRLQPREFVSEAMSRKCSRRRRTAGVVVEEYKSNVVPILGHPSRVCGSHLGKQETCQTRNIHLRVVSSDVLTS